MVQDKHNGNSIDFIYFSLRLNHRNPLALNRAKPWLPSPQFRPVYRIYNTLKWNYLCWNKAWLGPRRDITAWWVFYRNGAGSKYSRYFHSKRGIWLTHNTQRVGFSLRLTSIMLLFIKRLVKKWETLWFRRGSPGSGSEAWLRPSFCAEWSNHFVWFDTNGARWLRLIWMEGWRERGKDKPPSTVDREQYLRPEVCE